MCSGVCIFVGAKFHYIGEPWRAYLSYRYNDIISGFHSLFSYTLASKSRITI